MKNVLFATVALAVTLSLATPATAQNDNIFGTLLGAGLGGYFGSKVGKGRGKLAATALGVVLGAGVGSRFRYGNRSQTMFTTRTPRHQPRYRPYPRQHVEYPPHRPHRPLYRHAPVQRYEQPVPQYTQNTTQNCEYVREYQQIVIVGGREVAAWGRACYMPDGTFRTMDGPFITR